MAWRFFVKQRKQDADDDDDEINYKIVKQLSCFAKSFTTIFLPVSFNEISAFFWNYLLRHKRYINTINYFPSTKSSSSSQVLLLKSLRVAFIKILILRFKQRSSTFLFSLPPPSDIRQETKWRIKSEQGEGISMRKSENFPASAAANFSLFSFDTTKPSPIHSNRLKAFKFKYLQFCSPIIRN